MRTTKEQSNGIFGDIFATLDRVEARLDIEFDRMIHSANECMSGDDIESINPRVGRCTFINHVN